MKRNFKLLVLTLVAILAMSLGLVFSATAEKPTDTSKTTVYTNWWTNDAGTNFADNKFTISESGQANNAFANRPSANADLRENRYKFTLTVSTLDSGVDFYFTFDARGHGNAPWDLAANSVWVRLHGGAFFISGEQFNYATGMNVADGQPHDFEIIIDDNDKTVTLWIDDTSFVKQMETINEQGQMGFFVNQCDVVIDSPSLGFSAKEENTDAMTEWTNWWGALSFEHFGAADASTRTEASNAGQVLDANRYSFTLTISQVNNPVDFYFYADVRGHNAAPYGVPAGTVFLRLHQSAFFFCDETTPINYPIGMNPADGSAHEFEIVINDATKTVTLWIDNAYFTKTLDTLNASGTWGSFGMCATGAVTETCYGYTATGIEVTQEAGTTAVKMEETLALSVTRTPVAATTPVTWSSSDNNIATVDQNGVVTGVAEGNVVITATTATGIFDTFDVSVASNVVKPTSITLDKTAETVQKTQTLQLTATVNPDDTTDKGVVWSSNNESVATVDNTGLVTVIAGSGTAVITATCNADANIKADCTITAAPLAATAVSASNVTLEVGDEAQLTYTVTPELADDTFTVTVTDNTIVSYENGKLTALKAGDTTITITSNVTDTVTTTCTVSVVTPTAPTGMPAFAADKELAYVLGCDPSAAQNLENLSDYNYMLKTKGLNGSPIAFFPLNVNVPKTDFNMNAITFALKVDTNISVNDWFVAVNFRTASPATAFYSNPSGINFRFYMSEMQVVVNHGKAATAQTMICKVNYNENFNLADGLTHYYAAEVIGNAITVWVDGNKVLDNYDMTSIFETAGAIFNVSENNSFSIETRFTDLKVTDLHIYNTNVVVVEEYGVTANKVGQGTVTGVPEDKVEKDTVINVTVTAAEGWQVKSVKVNGEEKTLNEGSLNLTVTEDVVITVEFEEIDDGNNDGNGNGNENEQPKDEEKGGCTSSIALSSATMAVIALGGALVALKKKR